MDYSLVVLEQGIFLVGEVVRLKCDFQLMGRFGRRLKILSFALVNSLYKVEIRISFLGLLARLGIQPCGVFDVFFAKNVLVEPIQRLPLILGRLEGIGIEADRVMRTTCRYLVGLV